MKERDEKTGPSLVVCPLSVLQSWCTECKKWGKELHVLLLIFVRLLRISFCLEYYII